MRELRVSRPLLALGCGVLAASTLAAAIAVFFAPDLRVWLGAAFFLGAVVWAILAYAAGGNVGTWEAPTFLSSLTGVDPTHVADLSKKMSGPRSDVMLFAGVNALLLFLAAVLINLIVGAPFLVLLVATVATAVLLTKGGSRPFAVRSGP
ncbi:MAG TPA: hypothetical protein VEY12_07215 [Thermoplasmata archaeon]|nr:hypothetical protein [Thermoplasmata archaeon]